VSEKGGGAGAGAGKDAPLRKALVERPSIVKQKKRRRGVKEEGAENPGRRPR